MPFKRRDILKALTALPFSQPAWSFSLPRLDDLDDLDKLASKNNGDGITSLLPLKAGEITSLQGRACNGKSSVAMSIAFDYIDAGVGDVWYFCASNHTTVIAEHFGLELHTPEIPKDSKAYQPQPMYYRAYRNGQRLPLSFINESWAANMPLIDWPSWVPDLADSKPALVIYDYDHVDFTGLSDASEHLMAQDFVDRRDDCRKLPTALDLDRIDKTPRISELKPRGNPNRNPMVSELFFVHRPHLYDFPLSDDASSGVYANHFKLIRANRAQGQVAEQHLIWDKQLTRLRAMHATERKQLAKELEHYEGA